MAIDAQKRLRPPLLGTRTDEVLAWTGYGMGAMAALNACKALGVQWRCGAQRGSMAKASSTAAMPVRPGSRAKASMRS